MCSTTADPVRDRLDQIRAFIALILHECSDEGIVVAGGSALYDFLMTRGSVPWISTDIDVFVTTSRVMHRVEELFRRLFVADGDEVFRTCTAAYKDPDFVMNPGGDIHLDEEMTESDEDSMESSIDITGDSRPLPDTVTRAAFEQTVQRWLATRGNTRVWTKEEKVYMPRVVEQLPQGFSTRTYAIVQCVRLLVVHGRSGRRPGFRVPRTPELNVIRIELPSFETPCPIPLTTRVLSGFDMEHVCFAYYLDETGRLCICWLPGADEAALRRVIRFRATSFLVAFGRKTLPRKRPSLGAQNGGTLRQSTFSFSCNGLELT